MPQKSRWPLSIPYTSIPSFIFSSSSSSLSTTKLFIDPTTPSTRFLTSRSLCSWSQRFAAGLAAAGLQIGDRVMLFSGNSLFTPVAVLGVLMAGGIFVSANPAFTARELAYQMDDCEPRILIVADEQMGVAMEGSRMAKMDSISIYVFNELDPLAFSTEVLSETASSTKPSKHQSWYRLIAPVAVGEKFKWEDLNTLALANRTALLLYSSGTTGLPKGVEASHRNIVTSMMQIMGIQNLSGSSNRSTICALPMYHGLGLVYYTIVAPKAQLRVYLMARFSLQPFLEYIERFKVTDLLLVPPIVVSMAKSPRIRHFNLTSVRRVTAGAAPLGMEATALFEQLWPRGPPRLRQGWGMSEVPCMLFGWDDRDVESPSSTSVGEIFPGGEAMIVDEKGEEVKDGAVGELWCRAPNVMKGYWRNSSATNQTLTKEGWMQTGDLAYVDQFERFYIVDRRKELIKVKGAQVAPAEIEALLLEHPSIIDAAVIAAKTSDNDERPRAYVVRRADSASKLTEADVVDFVKSRVSKIKWITGGVCFIDEIPKNPSGKILRRLLRDHAKRAEGMKSIRESRL